MAISKNSFVVLLIFVTLLCACDVRESVDQYQERTFNFDPRKSVDSVHLILTTRLSWTAKYSPNYASADFYRLAVMAMPSTDWLSAQLVAISAHSASCLNPHLIGRVNFEWNMNSTLSPDKRQKLAVLVDAQSGLINSRVEYRSGDRPNFNPNVMLDFSRIDSVINAVKVWLSKNPQPEIVRRADCRFTFFTLNQAADHWTVLLGSQEIKRSIEFSVDTNSLVVERKK